MSSQREKYVEEAPVQRYRCGSESTTLEGRPPVRKKGNLACVAI